MKAWYSSPGWPAYALAGLVVLVVAMALFVTGGPGQGRKERRDETRLEDLARLSAQVECLARASDGALPREIATNSACPGEPRRRDPYTDAPYGYEILSLTRYRLCAGFETDLAAMMRWNAANIDPGAGCIHYDLPQIPQPRQAPPQSP